MAATLAAMMGIAADRAEAAPCKFQLMPFVREAGGPPPLTSEPFSTIAVDGATAATPFSFTIKAAGPSRLRWHGPVRPPLADLHQRLTVSRSLDGGETFEPWCETEWTHVSRLGQIGEMILEADGPLLWRAEVVQENRTPTVNILDDERSILTFAGSVEGPGIFSPPPYPMIDWSARQRPGPVPECVLAKEAATSDAIPVTASTIAEEGLHIRGTIYAVSGRHLYLRISAGSGPPVTVRARAKPVGYGMSPLDVCTIEIGADRPGPGEWISIWAPWQLFRELRWFIELESHTPSPALRYAVFRERPPSMPVRGISQHGSDLYSCIDTESGPEAPVDEDRAEPFQHAYALTIHTNIAAQGVTGEAHQVMVQAILTSIDTWRMACTACHPYQFSIVEIDGEVYVAQGLLHGTPGNFRATFAQLFPWHASIDNRKFWGSFNSGMSFSPVSRSLMQRERFCAQAPETSTGFSAADSPLCRPSPVTSENEMVIDFQWRAKERSCTGGSEVVACWNGSDMIEFNLADYSFYVGDTGRTLLGSGPRGADLIRVLTHEVGHWLGLEHMEGGGNIMAPTLAEARCIDDRNLQLVNAIARGQAPRNPGAEALHYD